MIEIPKKQPTIVITKPVFNTDEKTLNDFHQSIEKHEIIIEWFENDPGSTCYAYTIGLFKNCNHPELLVCGMDEQRSRAVLSMIAKIIEKENLIIDMDKTYTDLADNNLKLSFSLISNRNLAIWYERGSDYYRKFPHETNIYKSLPVLQMLHPDEDNILPFEQFYDLPVGLQPDLTM